MSKHSRPNCDLDAFVAALIKHAPPVPADTRARIADLLPPAAPRGLASPPARRAA